MNDPLAAFHADVAKLVAARIVGAVLADVARDHFANGYKTDCLCSVCQYRRDYAFLQSARHSGSYRLPSGEWVDRRKERRAENDAIKRAALAGFGA